MISIIIPVCRDHNTRETLGACLKSLGRQTLPESHFEIILIGDGCVIESPDPLLSLKVRIHNFPHPVGLVKTRNRGISMAQGDLIAFLDADCVADETWLAGFEGVWDNPEVGGCAGVVLDSRGQCLNKKKVYGDHYYLPFVGLGNAIFIKAVLEEIGGFDERFFMHEEGIDLSWRVILKGYRIEYAPRAVVHHRHDKSGRDYFTSGMGIQILSSKYHEILKASPLKEWLRYFFTEEDEGIENTFLFSKLRKLFLLCSGYFYAGCYCFFRIWPDIEKVTLSDAYLQPSSRLQPLAIEHREKKLFKPRHILWWKTEDACRVVNLLEVARHDLEGAAMHLWISLMNHLSRKETVEALCQEFDSEQAVIEKDLDEFIETVLGQGLLTAK